MSHKNTKSRAPRTRRAKISADRYLETHLGPMASSRRAFLRGTTGAILGLPLLELTSRQRAFAAEPSAPPKRLLIMSLGYSMDVEGSYDNFHLVPPHESGVLTGTSPILQALAPHAGKWSFVDGIDNVISQALSSNGHNASGRTLLAYQPHHGAAFNGDGSLAADQSPAPVGQVNSTPPSMWPIGPSIHYALGQALGVNPITVRVGGDNGEHARDFYASTDSTGQTIIQRNSGEPDPAAAFDSVFPGGGPSTGTMTPLERLRAKQGSVLDSVLTGFNRLITEVGTVDRLRLERHADHIRTIETELSQVVTNICEDPTLNVPPGVLPGTVNGLTDGNSRFEDVIADAHLKMIGTAFACQASPVAHLHFANMQSNKYPFLNDGVDLFGSGDSATQWHAAVHHDDGDGPAEVARRLKVMQWYPKLLADTITMLEGMPEGEGTVMDNTVIVWISSLRYSSHGTSNLPIIVAGDLGGQLNQGRYHDYSSHGAGGTLGDFWASMGNLILMDDLSNGWSGAPWADFGFNQGTNSSGRPFQNGLLPGLLS